MVHSADDGLPAFVNVYMLHDNALLAGDLDIVADANLRMGGHRPAVGIGQ